MKPIVVLTVIGARPQFVKAAPISAALAASGRFTEIVVHTGQHVLVRAQFCVGRSILSTTITSTGALVESNFSPSCS